MAALEVKFDNQLEFEPIIEYMYAGTEEETDGDVNETSIQQTKITGIVAPLISINGFTINYDAVKSLNLTNTDNLPRVSLVVNDGFRLFTSLNSPSSDNILRIQIIPPMEDKYKKINLNFFITNYSKIKDNISITAEYGLNDIYNSRLKSFGEVSTYEFIEGIAKELKLGFCTNVSDLNDKRYIYCPNTNYKSILDSEIRIGGSKEHILNWWVDFFNNLVLIDEYERFNSVDEIQKIMIENSGFSQPEINSDPTFDEFDAEISNHPILKNSPLYSGSYRQVNEPGNNLFFGTDRVLSIYDMKSLEHSETLIQDSDVKNDIFSKFVYSGEKFGEYDYITQKECHSMFQKKLKECQIIVELPRIIFGLMRGDKVNVAWYDLNNLITKTKETNSPENNIPSVDDTSEGDVADKFLINKMISGQYYINGIDISYKKQGQNNNWKYKLWLSRPLDQINTYVENGR